MVISMVGLPGLDKIDIKLLTIKNVNKLEDPDPGGRREKKITWTMRTSDEG